VSELCLGTVKFGAATPEDECRAILDCAIDAGVNLIDTARAYGPSEGIIGRALELSGKRGKVNIATKIMPGQNDHASIVGQCEQSLRNLKTDVIDLLQLHRPSPDVPIEESLRALDDLIRAGKVRYVGTSNFKAWQIMEALWVAEELGVNRFASEQAVYSLLCRSIEIEVLPTARKYNVGLLLWSPLGAGVITGRYSRASPPAHAKLGDRAWTVVETVDAMAREKGCTSSQLGLAWCLRQPGVTCPIAGPRTVQQLRDNLGAAVVDLTDEDLKRLDAVAPPGWTADLRWLW
jgi:aryl-alcohol dehydrogenase-like predicted oxidoreductase